MAGRDCARRIRRVGRDGRADGPLVAQGGIRRGRERASQPRRVRTPARRRRLRGGRSRRRGRRQRRRDPVRSRRAASRRSALRSARRRARGAPRVARHRHVDDLSGARAGTSRERLAERGVEFVDAPVSGGPVRARDGTLTIMVGASAQTYARAEPVLRAMGNPHHLGPVGMGETVKLVNQIIIANVMIANVEGLVFAQRSGADLDSVRAVLATATASNYLLGRVAAEDVARRQARRRVRARSAAQGSRGGARSRARVRLSDAGHGAGLPTLHHSLRKRGRRAGLQRDSEIV